MQVKLAVAGTPSAKTSARLIGGRNRVSVSCHLRHAAFRGRTTTFLEIVIRQRFRQLQ